METKRGSTQGRIDRPNKKIHCIKNKTMNFLQQLFGGRTKVDLKATIEEGAFLVDVRTRGEFLNGHVKGSVNIPLDSMPNQLGKFKNKKNIIVFCQSGGRSVQAKNILEQNGIANVINGGGWNNVNKFVK